MAAAACERGAVDADVAADAVAVLAADATAANVTASMAVLARTPCLKWCIATPIVDRGVA